MTLTPRIIVLRNPSAAGRGEKPIIDEWESPNACGELRNPVLFIHGVDYSSIDEVLEDFILPFERAAQLSETKQRDFVFLSWDSRLFSDEKKKTLLTSSIGRIKFFAREVFKWHIYLSDAESRARQAALFLIPYYLEISKNADNSPPLVVSHSLGSYLWASALKTLLQQNTNLKIGTWWNMQGAVIRSSFSGKGEFASVAQAYDETSDSKHVIWYSKFDFVLATLFAVAKRSLAIGQFGIRHQAAALVDVTKSALEAHGKNRMFGDPRCFFSRIAKPLQTEAASI